MEFEDNRNVGAVLLTGSDVRERVDSEGDIKGGARAAGWGCACRRRGMKMSVAIIGWVKVGSGVVLTRRGRRGRQESTRLGLGERLRSYNCHRIRT